MTLDGKHLVCISPKKMFSCGCVILVVGSVGVRLLLRNVVSGKAQGEFPPQVTSQQDRSLCEHSTKPNVPSPQQEETYRTTHDIMNLKKICFDIFVLGIMLNRLDHEC